LGENKCSQSKTRQWALIASTAKPRCEARNAFALFFGLLLLVQAVYCSMYEDDHQLLLSQALAYGFIKRNKNTFYSRLRCGANTAVAEI